MKIKCEICGKEYTKYGIKIDRVIEQNDVDIRIIRNHQITKEYVQCLIS